MTLCRRTSRKVVINDPPPRGEDGRGVWPCITRRFCLVRLVDGRFFAFMAANCRDLDVKLASSRYETVMKGIEACWNRFNPEI